MRLLKSAVEIGDPPPASGDMWHHLYSVCDSQLEKRFLDLLRSRGFRKPDKAQYWIPEKYSKPDFYYQEGSTCVFIDGPPHDTVEKAEEDVHTRARLVADGYKVLVFHHQRTVWTELIGQHPEIFGVGDSSESRTAPVTEGFSQ